MSRYEGIGSLEASRLIQPELRALRSRENTVRFQYAARLSLSRPPLRLKHVCLDAQVPGVTRTPKVGGRDGMAFEPASRKEGEYDVHERAMRKLSLAIDSMRLNMLY